MLGSRVIDSDTLSSFELEQAAIGSLLLAPELLSGMYLEPQHLYYGRHRFLMEAIREVHEQGKGVNQLTVAAELERQGKAKENCDLSYVMELVAKTATAFDFPAFETDLLDLYSRRQVKGQMERAATRLFDFSSDAGEMVNELVGGLPNCIFSSNGHNSHAPETVTATELISGESEAIQWIIPGYIAKGTVSMLGGPGKGGKSYILLDAAISLACGQPAWNRPIEIVSKVLYLDAENTHREVKRRVQGILKGRRMSALDNLILRIEPPYDMTKTSHARGLRKLIVETEADVVIVDSLIDFIGDSQENDNSDMRRVMREFIDISREVDCTIIIIHHTRKGNRFASGGQDGSRGASAIVNSVDDYFELKGSEGRGTVRGVALRSQQKAEGFSFSIIENAAGIHLAYGEHVREGETLADQTCADILAVLQQTDVGCKRADLLQILHYDGSEVSERTYANALKHLSQTGQISEKKHGREKLYRITEMTDTCKHANTCS